MSIRNLSEDEIRLIQKHFKADFGYGILWRDGVQMVLTASLSVPGIRKEVAYPRILWILGTGVDQAKPIYWKDGNPLNMQADNLQAGSQNLGSLIFDDETES